LEPVFGAAVDLGVAEARVESEVLSHRGVGVEPQLAKAVFVCVGLGVGHKGTAEAGALPVGVNGDIFDQQVMWSGNEDDEPCDAAAVVSNEDLAFTDLLGVVVVHGRRATANPVDVWAVGPLDEIAQQGDILVAGEANGHPPSFSGRP